jgi:hypothetical protein
VLDVGKPTGIVGAVLEALEVALAAGVVPRGQALRWLLTRGREQLRATPIAPSSSAKVWAVIGEPRSWRPGRARSRTLPRAIRRNCRPVGWQTLCCRHTSAMDCMISPALPIQHGVMRHGGDCWRRRSCAGATVSRSFGMRIWCPSPRRGSGSCWAPWQVSPTAPRPCSNLLRHE